MTGPDFVQRTPTFPAAPPSAPPPPIESWTRPVPAQPHPSPAAAPESAVAASPTDRERLSQAFEAIASLASCVDLLVREVRRGRGAQWRGVQDELSKARRLLGARAEPKEGPPRDEGPASQPPSP